VIDASTTEGGMPKNRFQRRGASSRARRVARSASVAVAGGGEPANAWTGLPVTGFS